MTTVTEAPMIGIRNVIANEFVVMEEMQWRTHFCKIVVFAINAETNINAIVLKFTPNDSKKDVRGFSKPNDVGFPKIGGISTT